MANKIAVIGAGSAVFSLNLIRDLCLTENLQGSTISLMDINQQRLDAIHLLCTRYAQEMGREFIVQKTTDRQEALQEANFVINTALAGDHDKLRGGWAVARELGYRFGGSYAIMHDEAFWVNFYQMKLFDSVIQDVLSICPDAWYIQLANPVLMGITYLTRKYPRAKIVGLCHGFSGVYHIARVLGLDKEHVTFQIPGVNHTVWLTHFYYKGENAFPLLDEWIEKKSASYFEMVRPSSGLGPKAVDLYKRFGVFPIGDTCTPGGGTWPWWYHVDEATERSWREDPALWWEGYFPAGQATVDKILRAGRDMSVKVTEALPPEQSGEVIVPLVESIACDIPRVIQANIANSGNFVPGVPLDFEVEIPTLVSKRGVQGIATDGLPAPLIAYILRDRVGPVEIEMQAYEQRSRELLLQLIMMDPWTRSQEQAQKLLDSILALPYLGEMREYYC
ncbi:MAG: family 4 glycosyl hydrolase [Anaerolineae bacterium]